METFVIAIVTAFIGAVLGWFGSRSLDRKRWLREQRLDVYLDVPAQVEDFNQALDLARLTSDSQERLAQVVRPMVKVMEALVRVNLIASEDVQETAYEVRAALVRHSVAVTDAATLAPREPSPRLPSDIRLQEAVSAFVTAARRDLGLDTKAR